MMKWKQSGGFTLIEAMYSVVLFIIVVMAIFAAYQALYRAMAVSEEKLFALEIAQNKFEELANVSYTQIGATTTPVVIQKNGRTYELSLSASSVDDPFDGLAPGDTDPLDYKHVHVTVNCSDCRNFAPIALSGRYAP